MPAPSPQLIKQSLLSEARRLMNEQDYTLGSAALALGMGKGTLHKWLARDEARRAGELREAKARGRKRKFAGLSHEEAQTLRAMALKHGSVAFAIERFVDHAICSAETRALISLELDAAARDKRRPRWPQTFRDAIMTRAEEEALFRGTKTFGATEHSPRKGMFYVDELGREIPIRSHTIWTADDYSTNQPYQIQTADGVRLCRQVLMAMDVFSAGWLSVEMIGRERDAYRGEDILRFLLRTIDGQGTMPLAMMLERGRWESRAIHGIPLDDLGAEFAGRTWGALDDLFTIIHGYSSRHKAVIESSFNLLQTALAHSGRDIGRTRGEFERATKLMLAVNAGRADATACGFLTQDQAREAHWQAAQILNARSRERSAAEFHGEAHVPNDLLMQQRDEARPLPAEERWRFMPVKRLVTVRGGFVEMSVEHYGPSFRFEVNGIGSLYVSNGHRVLVAFDPALPDLGCHIANAEARNRDDWKVGEALITAPFARDVAQFSLAPRGDGASSKTKANAAARTAFHSINPHKLGLTHTQTHDGRGNAAIASNQPAAPLAMPPAAKAARTAGVTVAGIAPRTRHATTAEPSEGEVEIRRATNAEALAAARRAALDAIEA